MAELYVLTDENVRQYIQPFQHTAGECDRQTDIKYYDSIPLFF